MVTNKYNPNEAEFQVSDFLRGKGGNYLFIESNKVEPTPQGLKQTTSYWSSTVGNISNRSTAQYSSESDVKDFFGTRQREAKQLSSQQHEQNVSTLAAITGNFGTARRLDREGVIALQGWEPIGPKAHEFGAQYGAGAKEQYRSELIEKAKPGEAVTLGEPVKVGEYIVPSEYPIPQKAQVTAGKKITESVSGQKGSSVVLYGTEAADKMAALEGPMRIEDYQRKFEEKKLGELKVPLLSAEQELAGPMAKLKRFEGKKELTPAEYETFSNIYFGEYLPAYEKYKPAASAVAEQGKVVNTRTQLYNVTVNEYNKAGLDIQKANEIYAGINAVSTTKALKAEQGRKIPGGLFEKPEKYIEHGFKTAEEFAVFGAGLGATGSILGKNPITAPIAMAEGAALGYAIGFPAGLVGEAGKRITYYATPENPLRGVYLPKLSGRYTVTKGGIFFPKLGGEFYSLPSRTETAELGGYAAEFGWAAWAGGGLSAGVRVKEILTEPKFDLKGNFPEAGKLAAEGRSVSKVTIKYGIGDVPLFNRTKLLSERDLKFVQTQEEIPDITKSVPGVNYSVDRILGRGAELNAPPESIYSVKGVSNERFVREGIIPKTVAQTPKVFRHLNLVEKVEEMPIVYNTQSKKGYNVIMEFNENDNLKFFEMKKTKTDLSTFTTQRGTTRGFVAGEMVDLNYDKPGNLIIPKGAKKLPYDYYYKQNYKLTTETPLTEKGVTRMVAKYTPAEDSFGTTIVRGKEVPIKIRGYGKITVEIKPIELENLGRRTVELKNKPMTETAKLKEDFSSETFGTKGTGTMTKTASKMKLETPKEFRQQGVQYAQTELKQSGEMITARAAQQSKSVEAQVFKGLQGEMMTRASGGLIMNTLERVSQKNLSRSESKLMTETYGKMKQDIRNSQLNRQNFNFGPATKLKGEAIQRSKTDTSLNLKFDMGEKSEFMEKTETGMRNMITQKTELKQAQAMKTERPLLTITKIKMPPIMPPPTLPPDWGGGGIPLPDFKGGKNESKTGKPEKEKAFKVYALERGGWKKLSAKPTYLESAKGLGGDYVDNTPSARFKVVRAKGPPESISAPMFPSEKFSQKGNFFTEKKEFRLDTIGEKKGLWGAGVMKKTRGWW
jgi:hypothetical protein